MPVRDEAWPPGTPCWVDAQVPDPAAARDFYARLFGWEIYDAPEGSAGYLMAYKNDKIVAGIGLRPGDLPQSTWTTYLATDDTDRLADRITAAGGALRMPPTDVVDAGRMLVATDPTGAVFGAWQAGARIGAAVHNEHGAVCWNELNTPDYEADLSFYTGVFGYAYDDLGDGVTMRYATFTVPGGQRPAGGVNDATLGGGSAAAHWLTWFQVDDADAATAMVAELGGTVRREPTSTTFGRSSLVVGAQGEAFGLIDPTTVPEA